MADLIMKRLMSLPLGTPVEISYGSAGFFYGFLSDRDEGCIELSGQRRDRLIIRYQGISSLKEWTSASSSGQEPQRDHYPSSFGQSPQWDQSSSSFGQEPQRDHYPSSFGQPPQMGQTSSRASFDEAPGPARLQKEKAEFDQGGQSMPSGEGAFLKEEPGAAADPHPGTVPEGGHPGEAPFLKETESSRDKKAPDESVIAPMPLTEKEAGTPDPSKAPSGEGHDSSLKAQAVPTDSPDQKEEAPSRAGVSFYQTTIPAPSYSPWLITSSYKALPKESKKILTSAFDSFEHGYKNKDSAKLQEASRRMAQELESWGRAEPAAYVLTGYALSYARQGERAAELFLRGQEYAGAALELYHLGSVSKAGASVLYALARGVEEEMVNVYFSLAEECLLSQKDISLLPETWEQISERFPKHSLALLEKLKEQAGIPSGEGSDIPAGEGSDIPVGKGSDIPAGEGSSFPAGKELEALRQAFPHTEMKDFALAHDFLSSPSSREAEVPAGEAKEEPLASDASQERAWQNAEENALGSSLGATLFSALQGFDEILPEGLKESIDSPQGTSEPEKEEDPSEAPPEEASPICLQAEDGSCPGYIYQSSWMQEKGSIYSYDDLAFYSFVFKDTEEPLRKALACAKPQDLKEKPIAVRFIKAGKNAKKIVLEQNPLEVALGLIRLRKDCEVLKEAYPLMKESRSRNLPGDDLVAYLQKVVAYHKKYGPEDKEILEQAKQFYDASWDKVQKVWPKISSLVQFQLALENTSKAISLLQTVLENFPLAIGEKLERRKELCRLLSQEYDRTKDLSYALELTRQAENYRSDFDVSDFQTRSNQSYLDFYWKSSSLYEAQAYMNLKNPDEALQAVKRLSSQTLSDEEKSRLGVVRSWLRSKGLLEPSPKAPGEKGSTENGPAGAQEAREDAGPSPDKASIKEEAAVEESSPGESQGEARPQDYDHSGLADLGMTAQDIFQLAMERRGNLRLPLLLCTLKAGASLDPSLEPAYRAASLAVANPMEDLDLNAGNLLTMFGEIKGEHQDFMEGCLACATLRSAFANEDSFSYHLTALRDSIGLFSELDSLSEVFRYLLEFRRDCQLPMDELAAYHGFDQGVVHSRLALAQEEGRRCYEKYICGAQDGDGLKTLFYTKMLLYAEDGPVGKPLRLIAGKDYDSLLALKKEFMDRWIEGSTISEDAISQKAILNFFDECWRQGQIMDNNRSKSFKLQGQRKNNVCQSIQACLAAVARCFVALDFQPDMEEQQILAYYHRLLPGLMGSLRTLEQDCARLLSQVPQGQKNTSCFLLSLTASQIRRKLSGDWKEEERDLLFAPLLASGEILLGEDFLPELDSTLCALPGFNIFARLSRAETFSGTLKAQVERIYSGDPAYHDFGQAELILLYQEKKSLPVTSLPDYAGECVQLAAIAARQKWEEFRRRYALFFTNGHLDQGEIFLMGAEQLVGAWYQVCQKTQCFGFFHRLVEDIYAYVSIRNQKTSLLLREKLSSLKANNPDIFARHPQVEGKILELIEDQRFSAAEFEMNGLMRGEIGDYDEAQEAIRYLQDFWSEYDFHYRQMSNLSRNVSDIYSNKGARNKDQKGANGLIDSWLKSRFNGRDNSDRIGRLLYYLGFTNVTATYRILPGNSLEYYHVAQTTPVYGRFTPQHLIAPFGSLMAMNGFEVVCLYGAYDCNGILEKCGSLDNIKGGARLVLLDCVLSAPERRALARKMRKSGFFHTYMVLDRVLLSFLCQHYKGTTINRMLMSLGMPFAWYQPYVADSSNYMAPEMFIGRSSELRAIEEPSASQADSVNLIYGGRQLGKTSLLKKAVSDTDCSDGKRAVYVDLFESGTKKSAQRLLVELVEKGILPDEGEVQDWDELVARIRRRLRAEGKEEISYLLIMLDEADSFIKDCAEQNYAPISELKRLQEAMPDRFKFVIAGLHNIVRYNRSSALASNTGIPHLKSLSIKPFTKAEAYRLLREPLSYLGFVLEDETKAAEIVSQTNCFPGLIQLYCQKLVESVRNEDYGGFTESETPPYVVSNDLIGRVLSDNQFSHEIRNKFEMTLLLEKRYYLIALLIAYLSLERGGGTSCSVKDVMAAAQDLKIRHVAELNQEQVMTLMEELLDLNILRPDSNTTYTFASSNFRTLIGNEEEISEKLVKIDEEDWE